MGEFSGGREKEELGRETVKEVEVSSTESSVANKEEKRSVWPLPNVLMLCDEVEEERGRDDMAMVRRNEVLLEDEMRGR